MREISVKEILLKQVFELKKRGGRLPALKNSSECGSEHHLRDEPTGSGTDDDKCQAGSHVTVVKHKAAQASGAGTVTSRATDLSATRDDEVTVAGSPDTD